MVREEAGGGPVVSDLEESGQVSESHQLHRDAVELVKGRELFDS